MVSRYDSGLGSNDVWAGGEEKDDGNPLVEFADCFQDDDAPVVEPIESSTGPVDFEFIELDGDTPEAHELKDPVVIVAVLHDQCAVTDALECTWDSDPDVVAAREVAPLAFKLGVRCTSDSNVAEQVYALDLKRDVRAKQVAEVYGPDTIGTCSQRKLRFNLSYDPPNKSLWTPPQPGTYELDLTVEDAAGHTITRPPFQVTVH